MSRTALVLGDLRFVDENELGFSVYHVSKLDHKICWLNLRGERELLQWLVNKPIQQGEELPLGGSSKLSEIFEESERERALDDADTGAVPGFTDGDS